ncbi:MAG: alpha-amylase family glycosyl hydrolase [Opitutales bacterium]
MSQNFSHILGAYWMGPGQACVLLARDWKKKTLPPIRLQNTDLELSNLRRMKPSEVGRFTGYYESGGEVVFCIEPKRYPQIDFEADPIMVAGPFNDWGRAEDPETFRLSRAEESEGGTLYRVAVPRARIVSAGKRMTFKFVTQSWHWLTPQRCAPNLVSDQAGNLNYALSVLRSGQHAYRFDVAGGQRGLDQVAQVSWRDERPQLLVPGLSFYDLESQHACGPVIEPDNTVFRLFAPRATRVELEIDEDPAFQSPRRHPMALGEDRVTWELTLEGNCHGCFYRLFVDGPDDGRTTHFDFQRPLLDPWARATLGPEGPGVVLDPAQQPCVQKPYTPPPEQDMTVLECHVRDLVQNAPLELTDAERRGFAGVAKYLRQPDCYPLQLGLNTLEFQPVQQFDSRSAEAYHWGYMTNNFFAPCAWYGTAPERASQNEEFFDLVQACHEQNFAVILDVVYNHLGEPPNLLFIDKAYYFHLTPGGDLENWSGCGNVLRAESAMSRRLITESLLHFVEAYDVDGFRFDLAELIGIDVLKPVGDALRAVKPGLALITEPWSFRGSIQWDCRMAGYGYWNDGFRECLKEYVWAHSNPGALAYYAKGCLDHMAAWPSQSVNYVESHDDRCWLDDITENEAHNGEHPTEHDLLRTHMMAAILFCSVGVPMLSCGQDFMRSKKGINNTYQMGDINALDYQRLEAFAQTHAYFKAWIAFRQSHWGEILRLEQVPDADYLRTFLASENSSSAMALLFNADRALGKRQILLAVNPHFEDCRIHLGDVDAEGWSPLADIRQFDFAGIGSDRLDTNARDLHLGPMDLGLWVRGSEDDDLQA